MSDLPLVVSATQEFPRPKLESVSTRLEETFSEAQLPNLNGKRIALAVGSRGISNLQEIVGRTAGILRSRGAECFVVPAMGSHGGGTSEGQSAVIEGYGITESLVGVSVVSSMEVVVIGETEDGTPVHVGKAASDADGIILINRVKPHTDFKGKVGSGLMKMIAVGVGNRFSADSFHSWTLKLPYEHLILAKARALLASGKVLGGVAVVENAYHEIAVLDFVPASRVVTREMELLEESRRLMPSLPVDNLDLLILDRIGKDISGTGMDPNITGRWFRLSSIWQEKPEVIRIVVLDLSAGSHGNACGVGLADFCSRRVVDKLDRRATNLNAVTCRNTQASHTPIYFDSDRETILQALKSLAEDTTSENVRMLRIRDTLHLSQFQASPAVLEELRANKRVQLTSDPGPMLFEEDGSLRSLPNRAD